MKLRSLALAVLAFTSISAQAALTTYAPWDSTYPNIAGVQFNVVTVGGATLAMGAHPYINGTTMANNGISTYYADPGLSNPARANWSFDYAWDLGSCAECTVGLLIDTDPGTGVSLQELALTAPGSSSYFESWNMAMSFIPASFNFNPNSTSSTLFSLVLRDANGVQIGSSDITVDVPEPGSLALLGLGLAGLAGVARRRKA